MYASGVKITLGLQSLRNLRNCGIIMFNLIDYINAPLFMVLMFMVLMGVEAFGGPKIISQALILTILTIGGWSFYQDLQASQIRLIWIGVGLIAGIAIGIAFGILWASSELFRAFWASLLVLLIVLKAIYIGLLARYLQRKR